VGDSSTQLAIEGRREMIDGRQDEDRDDDARYDTVGTPIARLREFIERDRLDIAALIWLAGVLAVMGAITWTSWRTHVQFSAVEGESTTTTWIREYSLAVAANISYAVALAVGIAVAAALDTKVSRVAAILGIVGGLWFALAGGCGVAYAIHAAGQQSAFTGASAPFTVQAFVAVVFGLLLAAAAWRLATSVPLDDIADEDAEPQMVS
jgi:hypothetical protein